MWPICSDDGLVVLKPNVRFHRFAATIPEGWLTPATARLPGDEVFLIRDCLINSRLWDIELTFRHRKLAEVSLTIPHEIAVTEFHKSDAFEHNATELDALQAWVRSTLGRQPPCNVGLHRVVAAYDETAGIARIGIVFASLRLA